MASNMVFINPFVIKRFLENVSIYFLDKDIKNLCVFMVSSNYFIRIFHF